VFQGKFVDSAGRLAVIDAIADATADVDAAVEAAASILVDEQQQ